MPEAISNTSPLLYLYRIGAIELLPALFNEVWSPEAVRDELNVGFSRGYDVPDLHVYPWITIVNPSAMPSEWLALDLGPGEIAAMALALEYRERVILLDDRLARCIAQAAGLQVWGTLKVLIEAKRIGLIDRIAPFVNRLSDQGMWISVTMRRRILSLAREDEP
ncbi:MAG: DUF3368 domain-containing protein [Roseiflexus castenholzii]|uniref:DUF3368 domain-containing protein n=1 Tax=Roseiflexus castenholzii TaxID=120962 RepID=UPI000CBF1D3A|nr:MAG: DUF3368 domain-containing protein [Roseiflexus castenholzii]